MTDSEFGKWLESKWPILNCNHANMIGNHDQNNRIRLEAAKAVRELWVEQLFNIRQEILSNGLKQQASIDKLTETVEDIQGYWGACDDDAEHPSGFGLYEFATEALKEVEQMKAEL